MNKTLFEVFGNMKVWEFLVVFSVAYLIKGFLVAMFRDIKKGKLNE